jgi:hypothetical protein
MKSSCVAPCEGGDAVFLRTESAPEGAPLLPEGLFSASNGCVALLERLVCVLSVFQTKELSHRQGNRMSNSEKAGFRNTHMHLSFLEHGVTMCALRDIRGMAYKVPVDKIPEFFKDQAERFKKREKEEYCIDKSCVYLFIGEATANDDGRTAVYVGETDDIRTRIQRHNVLENEAYSFQYLIIFCRTDYDFNKGSIEHIERKIIEFLVNQENVKLANGQSSDKMVKQITLGMQDREVANNFVESILILTKALGCDIFESTGSIATEAKVNTKIPMFQIWRSDKRIGDGQMLEDGFLVIRNTAIVKDESASCRPSYRALRKKLRDEKVVVDGVEDEFFEKNYVFENPTLAASVIMGRNTNGHTAWRNPDIGQTLGEWRAKTDSAKAENDKLKQYADLVAK